MVERLLSRRAVTGQLVTTPMGDIHVLDEGAKDAPPLLLIHGFAGSVHWWDRVVADLTQDHRVIRLDLLGHGASDAPATGYDAPLQAEAVANVLDQLNVRDVVAVGHSLGTHVVIALAELDRDRPTARVQRLVLIDQSPSSAAATIPASNQIMVTRGLGAMLHRHAPAAAVRIALRMAFAPGFDLATAFDDPNQGVLDVRMLPHACYREMQLGLPRFVDTKSLDARLTDLALPTLVVFGDQDGFHDPDRSCAEFSTIPGVRIERIPTAGHTPMVETPARFLELVRSFLAP